MIYGAGVSGLITKRTVENDTKNAINIAGFIDDNPKFWGTRIEGTNVYGPQKPKRD